MAEVIHDFGPLEHQLDADIGKAIQKIDQLKQQLKEAENLLNTLHAMKSTLHGEPVSLLATTVFPRKKRKYDKLPEHRPLKIAAQHLRRAKERGAPKAEIARLEKERDDAQAALRAAKLKKDPGSQFHALPNLAEADNAKAAAADISNLIQEFIQVQPHK